MAKEIHAMAMIPLGTHKEPDGDEPEDGEEDGELEEHEYTEEAQDVLDALEEKDANKLAHALENFISKCK